MRPDEETLLRELIAEHQIRRTLLSYFRGVDRKDFELMASAFHPDAYDDHGPYKGDVEGLIAWTKDRHSAMDQSMHFVGNISIEVSGDVAAVESYCIAYQHIRTGGSSFATREPVYRKSVICFRYVDRFEQREGEWKIAHRICAFEWAEDAIGKLTFGGDLAVSKRDRSDPIYQILDARPPAA